MTTDSVQILWDVVTRQVLMIFQGQVIMLEGRFKTEEEGRAAAQAHCRQVDWPFQQNAA